MSNIIKLNPIKVFSFVLFILRYKNSPIQIKKKNVYCASILSNKVAELNGVIFGTVPFAGEQQGVAMLGRRVSQFIIVTLFTNLGDARSVRSSNWLELEHGKDFPIFYDFNEWVLQIQYSFPSFEIWFHVVVFPLSAQISDTILCSYVLFYFFGFAFLNG